MREIKLVDSAINGKSSEGELEQAANLLNFICGNEMKLNSPRHSVTNNPLKTKAAKKKSN